MSLSPADIRSIVDALQDSDWDQASIAIGEVRISVARNGLPLDGGVSEISSGIPPQQAPVMSAPTSTVVSQVPMSASEPQEVDTPSEVPTGAHVITAPSVGVFWQAPQPGATPFVTVGQRVSAGDTIGIVEVMKLMTNVSADLSGEVVGIHVANAGQVEFGTPLVSIRADR